VAVERVWVGGPPYFFDQLANVGTHRALLAAGGSGRLYRAIRVPVPGGAQDALMAPAGAQELPPGYVFCPRTADGVEELSR